MVSLFLAGLVVVLSGVVIWLVRHWSKQRMELVLTEMEWRDLIYQSRTLGWEQLSGGGTGENTAATEREKHLE